MRIPNLLVRAVGVIGDTGPVAYFKYAGRAFNDRGIYLTSYLAPATINGTHVQAVDRAKYEAMGLDFNKTYTVWYVPNLNAIDIERDTSGDVIEYAGRRSQLEGVTDWFVQNGWKSFLCVDIGPATGALTNA